MRLLYAFPEPLPLPRARGIQVANAVASLARTGVDVTLAYVPSAEGDPQSAYGMEPSPLTSFLSLSRGWPKPLTCIPPFSRWHSVRFFASRMVTAVAESGQPVDMVYVRHLKLAGLLRRRFPGLPLVYEAHEVFADTVPARKRAKFVALEQEVVSGAAAIVANSKATADRLEALYGRPKHLLILPNGVTRPVSLPDKPWHECAKHVIYAGSFFGWKGVSDLLSAAAMLPGFRITLIGGDDEQVARLRAAAPLPEAELEFLPRLPQKQVMEYLQSACIAVLPNRPELDSSFTSPIKLFEYMAAGCAVVASDLPPIREVLAADEAAWFVPGDAHSLAQAIRALASNPAYARNMGERLREKSENYTWRNRAQQLKAFLEEAIGSR